MGVKVPVEPLSPAPERPASAQPAPDSLPIMSNNPPKPIIFVSYAHADEPEKPAEGEIKWLSFVTGYLRPAEKRGEVEVWTDRLMRGGDGWEPDIERKLRSCDIFILLVSHNSTGSDYIGDKEIAIIRERQAKGEDVHFYPLLLTPTPKAGLDMVRDRNMRPRDARPLSSYPLSDRSQHMVDAANEIVAIAGEIATRKNWPARPSPVPAPSLATPQASPEPEPTACAPDLQPIAAKTEDPEAIRKAVEDAAPVSGALDLPPIAAKTEDLEAIRKAVEDAAPVSGALWFSYLCVLFYLAVAAGAVTHADLFFENPVKLPFLNIELPPLAFFFGAPILFLVVHAYTLVHLVMLTDKTKRFDIALRKQIGDESAAIRDSLRRQLPSNIFIQLLAGPSEVRESAFGRVLWAIAWVTLVIAPVLLLLMMQIQGASFAYARLQGASLNGALLGAASFDHAVLAGASLNYARLQGATFDGALLYGASLVDAQLQGASLDGAQLGGATLETAELQGATLQLANLQATDLSEAYLWRTNRASRSLGDVPQPGAIRFPDRPENWRPSWPDNSAYQDLGQVMASLPPGALRDQAMERIRRLDCAYPDPTLASCDASVPPPHEADTWRISLENASVNDDYSLYARILALQLDAAVCSAANDAVYVLRGLLDNGRLAAAGSEVPRLVDKIINAGKSKDCPGSASLTDFDKARLLRVKQDAIKGMGK